MMLLLLLLPGARIGIIRSRQAQVVFEMEAEGTMRCPLRHAFPSGDRQEE